MHTNPIHKIDLVELFHLFYLLTIVIRNHLPITDKILESKNDIRLCALSPLILQDKQETVHPKILCKNRILLNYENDCGLQLLEGKINEIIQPNQFYEWDLCAWHAILQNHFSIKNLKTLEDIKYNTENLRIPAYIIFS
jgi:hypothetical protein